MTKNKISHRKSEKKSPSPLFDSINFIDKTAPNTSSIGNIDDFKISLSFLKSYQDSIGTFNSYRREIERLLHWCWKISKKTLKDLKREDIENFIRFCQKPLKSWIGTKKAERFIEKDGQRIQNPEWRPFVTTIPKVAHRKKIGADIKNFELSQGAIKQLFAILSTFYNYLLQEEYVFMNPVALIRQKNKFIQKQQTRAQIRRLTELQWTYIIKTSKFAAENNPEKHERTLFIITALYTMHLRISELTKSPRWTPKMCDFHRDHTGNWWFTTVGKENKQRQIAVSDEMLKALQRYRKYLGLTALPSPADAFPLLTKTKGKGPITSNTYIREIVQTCFDQAIAKLNEDGHSKEAESLNMATAHWLRHTSISDDVRRGTREHVRDDANNNLCTTTDKYELRARHRSAKNKSILCDA